jgi:hypothetical protein
MVRLFFVSFQKDVIAAKYKLPLVLFDLFWIYFLSSTQNKKNQTGLENIWKSKIVLCSRFDVPTLFQHLRSVFNVALSKHTLFIIVKDQAFRFSAKSRNPSNVSEWSDISTRWLLFRLDSTITIQREYTRGLSGNRTHITNNWIKNPTNTNSCWSY